jgi:P27 family predicted phage terminase small subunit
MPQPRKPIARHRLQGTYRPDRQGARREVEAPDELTAGAAPPHLTEVERRIWAEALDVAPPHLLKSADSFTLEVFVAAVAAHREARAARAATGLLLEPERGDRIAVINPLTGEIRRQARLIAELGAKLGLTPDARLRLLDGIRRDPDDVAVDAEFLRRFGPLQVIPGGRREPG